MFFDIYADLCKKDGKTPTAVALELNIARSSVSYWRSGAVPKQDILVKIAKRFNVSVDYLLGEEDKEKKTTDNDGLSEEEKALLDLFNRVPADSRPMILEMIRAAVNTL